MSTSTTARSPSQSTPFAVPRVGAPAGEPDGDLAATQVVGIGQDAAVGDDDAGAADTGADPDDGRADGRGDGGDGLLELVEHGHDAWILVVCVGSG